MPFQIVRADYARIDCDAVVISTSYDFVPMVDREGPDNRTTAQGGSQRRRARELLGKIPAGTAKITPPGFYEAKAKRVIYTVCPRKNDTNPKLSKDKVSYMKSCYRSCLNIAVREHLNSIAFVLIGARNRGFDLETCLNVAFSEILHFISDPDHPERTEMTIILTVFGKHELDEAARILREKYILPCIDIRMGNQAAKSLLAQEYASIRKQEKRAGTERHAPSGSEEEQESEARFSAFTGKLYEYFRNKGISENEFYETLHQRDILSRQTFYNMRQKPDYTPSKRIVLASAMALHLTLAEAEELLSLAGYTFQSSDPADRKVVAWFKDLDFRHLDFFQKEQFSSRQRPGRKSDGASKKKWKYEPLSAYFKRTREKTVSLTFSQIEDILGFNLPASYRTNRTMWYPRNGSRTMADAWTAHGYRLKQIDIAKGTVSFSRHYSKATAD